MKEIDFEKDHLIIFRNENGKFTNFRWYPSENCNNNEMQERIKKSNEKQFEHEEYHRSYAELVTDKLVREVCAYREAVSPYEDVLRSAQDTLEAVEETKNALHEAMDLLENVKL